MSLTTYNRKRDFKRTSEPKGKTVSPSKGGLSFVIQKHDASRLHYDFRLEVDGVLKSWAVPKGPSLDPERKTLAVQVEDHPLDYGEFEGTIPKGQYGGGTVMLWDRGTWEPVDDPRDGLRRGRLRFALHGEKLQGEWALVRIRGSAGEEGKNWLLIKAKGAGARSADVLKKDKSVKTGRSMRQIAENGKVVRPRTAKATTQKKAVSPKIAIDSSELTGARKASMPQRLAPQLATLSEAPPVGAKWVHEIKFDGYRILVHVRNNTVKLLTRNGKNYTAKFPTIERACRSFAVKDAVLDGEIVILDEKGVSDFQSLQAMLKHKEKAAPTLYLFDLPYCNGFDLTKASLEDRKTLLRRIFDASPPTPAIQYSDHTAGDGAEVVAQACRMSLEGIISKRIDSPYVGRRDGAWLKSKCGQRQEFVIIGWTDPQGGRKHFGSLLIGYYDKQKRLVYAGRVGTGFDERLLADLLGQLRSRAIDEAPTDIEPPKREMRAAHWVKPELIGEVRFTGWTRDGVLRHPAFMGLRADKRPSQVVREEAVKPGKAGTSPAVRASKIVAEPRGEMAGEVAGVSLSHPDKILYPEQGLTKQGLAAYYEQVAERMLPYVAHRPLALVRCPGGRESKCFFQRNYSDTLPAAIKDVNVGEGRKKEMHIAIGDRAGVISLVQIGVLEIHTWGCRNDEIEKPDLVIFDLDPGPGIQWKQVVAGARQLRKTLQGLRLPAFLKTSGGKGLHITLPIKRTIDWESAKSFSETIAQALAAESPGLFVANMRKDLREGKIYIDYHRNGRGATAVTPYSSRARTDAPVSMPINWEDLSRVKSAAQFTVGNAFKQLKKPDPWRDFEAARVDLRKAVGDVS